LSLVGEHFLLVVVNFSVEDGIASNLEHLDEYVDDREEFHHQSFSNHRLAEVEKVDLLLKHSEAVFLVMCDPPMNEL
jgi:hypothetical protein